MASRIAGITVEIGGDTTKLSKALESVNKTIKTTQSELKDVNKLLKLDPSNTETVTQKQRKSRKMSCRLFSELLYKEMDWSGDCRYKILGYRIEFEGEALYVFDLVAAEVFHECKKKQSADQQPTTVAEENTEEQPVNPRKGYYPDDIAGTFGMPVEQHRQESELRQMDGFVSVGMLTGMPGQQQNL